MRTDELDYSRPNFKTLFANYGLTAVAAVGLEKSVMLLIAALDTIGKGTLPKEALNEHLLKYRRKTMGALISELEKRIFLPTHLKADLDKALVDRNMIIHHFFVDEYETMLSHDGPTRLSNQLRPIRDFFVSVQSKIDDLLGLVSVDLNKARDEMNPDLKNLLKTVKPFASPDAARRR